MIAFSAQFEAALSSVDVVSFDIFDTAVVRAIEQPVDAFLLLAQQLGVTRGRDFQMARIVAEKKARAKQWEQHRGVEVTLADIYAELAAEWLQYHSAEVWMAAECALEIRLARPRAMIAQAFERARACGKRVGFVSDMYLDEATIRKILTRSGYLTPDFLWISSQEKQTKAHGGLYSRLCQSLAVSAAQVLHIGDNRQADVEQARKAGLQSIWIPKCGDTLPRTHYGKRLARAGIDAATHQHSGETAVWRALLRGLLATQEGDDTRSSTDRTTFWASLGYAHAGPLILGFILWLDQQATRAGVSRLYFLARDGHIMQTVHAMLQQHKLVQSSGQYLYGSRRALNIPAIFDVDEASCDFLVSGSSRLTVRQFLERIGLSADMHLDACHHVGFESLEQLVQGGDYGKLRALFRQISPSLLQHAATERTLLQQYWREQGLFSCEHIGLVDIGWHGSLQHSTRRLLSSFGYTGRLSGFYLGTFTAAAAKVREGDVHHGWLCHSGEPVAMQQMIRQCVELFEWLFCAPHGGVVCFEPATAETIVAGGAGATLVPRFETISGEEFRHDSATQMQRGALAFIQDVIDIYPAGGSLPTFPAELATGMFNALLKKPSLQEASLLGDIPHVEGFGAHGSIRYVARPPQFAGTSGFVKAVWQGWRQCFWRRAYLRRLLGGNKASTSF